MRHVNNLVSDDEIEDAEVERKIKDSKDTEWDLLSDDISSDDDDDDDFMIPNNISSESNSSQNPWDFNYGDIGYSQQVPQKSSEDKIIEGIKDGCKAFIAFLKDFIVATKQVDTVQAVKWGTMTIITSVIITIIGLILAIFGIKIGLPMLIGSLISLASGLAIFGISFERQKNIIKKGNIQVDDNKLITDDEDEEEIDLDVEDDYDEDEEDEDKESYVTLEKDTEKNVADSFFNDEDEEDAVEEDDAEDLDFFDNTEEKRGKYRDEDEDEEDIEKNEILDADEKKERIASINISSDVVTRQYLMEAYESVLPEVTPKYCRTIDYDEDDRDFKEYAGLIRKAALSVNGKKKEIEDMPKLEKLQEKSLYTKIVVTRSHSISVDKFVQELTQLLRYNQETDEVDDKLYITYNVVGDKWILKIFTGETAKVSIMDTYNDKEVREFIANKKNIMPVILGINEEGKAIYLDIEKLNSLLVTGMPRSGKSWFALALLTQMTMYMKPSQLEIYMIDPKGASSDFIDLMPPHVKCFVSEHQDIIDILTKLIDVEAKRRTELFATQNIKKIQDWNVKNPLNPCPYIYVYIDEVVTLAEAMDKETKQIFQSKLMEITTRLPSLGIRPILVPHIVKDQVLKKSITDNIPCRISVKGDAKHIESCVGVDDPPFTYRLTHVGDMAVMLLDRHIHFVHSVIITEQVEDNIEIFEYIRQLWEKLEPESIPSSCYYKKMHGIPLTVIGEEKGNKIQQKISISDKKVSIKKRADLEEDEGVELSKFIETTKEEKEIEEDKEKEYLEDEEDADEELNLEDEDEELDLEDEDEDEELDLEDDSDSFMADIFGDDI